MQVTRIESMVKIDGVGLSGVQATIRKNRSTFRRLLSLFKTHFTVRNGVVKTTVAAPVPAVETSEERRLRMDRQFDASQRLREEQDRKREEKKQAARDRLRDMRGVYGNRPAA